MLNLDPFKLVRSAVVLCLVAPMVTHCAQQPAPQTVSSAGGYNNQPALPANQKQDSGSVSTIPSSTTGTCLYVTDASQTTVDPAIVQLVLAAPTAQDPSYWLSCTATFIGPNALITAAHCLDATQTNDSPPINHDLTIKLNGTSVPITMVHYMSWAGEDNSPTWPWQGDIAVLEVAPGLSHETIGVATTQVAVGDALTIVGYGQTQVISAGDSGNPNDLKFIGTNHIQALGDNDLYYVGVDGTKESGGLQADAVSGAGDSGGPVLINGLIAGTVSGGEQLVSASNVAAAFPTAPSSFTNPILAQIKSGAHLASEVDQNLTAAPNMAFLQALAGKGLAIQFGTSTLSSTATSNTPSNNVDPCGAPVSNN